MDTQFLRCHSNTKKCNILDNCETLGEQHECRINEVYVAPIEIPKDGNVLLAKVVRRKGKYTIGQIIVISADFVRKCFSKTDEYVEEGS